MDGNNPTDPPTGSEDIHEDNVVFLMDVGAHRPDDLLTPHAGSQAQSQKGPASRRMDSVGRPFDHDTNSVISVREYGRQDGEAGSATDLGGNRVRPITRHPPARAGCGSSAWSHRSDGYSPR